LLSYRPLFRQLSYMRYDLSLSDIYKKDFCQRFRFT